MKKNVDPIRHAEMLARRKKKKVCHYWKERREWIKKLRDMSKCPECGKRFETPKTEGEYCDPTEVNCESVVVKTCYGLVWNNPNWG